MIFVLAILAATHASPIGIPSPHLVSRDQLQTSGPSCDDPNGCRSLGDIIRSCILTILLCTWVSMHPNIPSPYERWPRVAARRAGLMLLALFVPEAVIAWALRQRLTATELAKKHKGEGWTRTHGFYAIMGGFMEYEGNRPIKVLLPEQLESYSLTGNGDFPRLSKAEIEDKSKGDAISKAVVILQTGWFVTQCIVRGVQGLPITELELATVAFAALNFVIYLLWWDKPQNVQRGVRVYKKRMTEEPIDDGNVDETVGFWDALGNSLSHLPATIAHGPVTDNFKDSPWLIRVLTEQPTKERGLTELQVTRTQTQQRPVVRVIDLDIACRPSTLTEVGKGNVLTTAELRAMGMSLFIDIPRIRVLMWPLFKPLDVISVENGVDVIFDMRVNTFYPTRWATGSENSLLFLVAAITLAFGGIHCIGWSFTFPSSIERTLWRVASLSITGFPILFLLLGLLGSVVDNILLKNCFDDLCVRFTLTLPLLLYILSRWALLVLPFLCLRSLPPAAFRAIQWTSFIPHV
ncbi:hypothetical protein BC827DRAFT_1142138 [Russula dissimulans]|nr:hypothetical protein BC827DRAFT_1142138 [Russula dissimulans]